MNTSLKIALVVAAISSAAAPVFAQGAYSQLAANAGLSQSEAAGMTDAQITTAFFNRGKSFSDRQPVPQTRADMSARNQPDMGLRAVAAEMSNRGKSIADRQPIATPTPGMSADRSQLAASAGLGIDGADGRSLTELATALYNRGMSTSDTW